MTIKLNQLIIKKFKLKHIKIFKNKNYKKHLI